jgi:hypothetical protein
MQYKTFAQIRAKVERELDTEVEEFVQPQEFIEYVNDGIAMAEAEIHKLGLEDEYFLSKYTLSLVQGQEDYPLPAAIYMNKIRAVTYRFGTTIYTIERMRGPDKFENLEHINQYNSITDYYKYLIRNDSAAAGVTLQLVPPARETNPAAVRLWYIRECNKWTTDENMFCDLPQIAMQFLYQYCKYRIYEKEVGHPNMLSAKEDLGSIRATMIETMEQMVADDNNEITRDLSNYQDMS